MGFPAPENENPADFLIDAINGFIKPTSYSKGKQFSPMVLVQVWQEGAKVVNKQIKAIKEGKQLTELIQKQASKRTLSSETFEMNLSPNLFPAASEMFFLLFFC